MQVASVCGNTRVVCTCFSSVATSTANHAFACARSRRAPLKVSEAIAVGPLCGEAVIVDQTTS
eukprot:9630474-Karenia_brevis.AAC.1